MSYSKTSSYSSHTAPGTLRPPRITSAYQRTFESHRNHSVDLDTFEIPTPLLSPSRNSFSSVASTPAEERPTSRRLNRTPSVNNPNDLLPNLGEVDLSDGKNTERPQRFKATIHFNCKKTAEREAKDEAGRESNEEKRYRDNHSVQKERPTYSSRSRSRSQVGTQ